MNPYCHSANPTIFIIAYFVPAVKSRARGTGGFFEEIHRNPIERPMDTAEQKRDPAGLRSAIRPNHGAGRRNRDDAPSRRFAAHGNGNRRQAKPNFNIYIPYEQKNTKNQCFQSLYNPIFGLFKFQVFHVIMDQKGGNAQHKALSAAMDSLLKNSVSRPGFAGAKLRRRLRFLNPDGFGGRDQKALRFCRKYMF